MIACYARRRFLAACGALGLLALPHPLSAQAVPVGRVAVIQGEAWRRGAGGDRRLEPGESVAEGDRLATGVSSRLQVLFVDGTLLTLGPESEFECAHYAPAAGEQAALLRLLAGILRVAVDEQAEWETFEVESGTAVASVRATEWVVTETESGSAVFVLSGRVAVTGKAVPETVLLDPGDGTDVPAGGAPTPPKNWGQGRVDRVLALVNLL